MMTLDGWADIARPLIYGSNAQNLIAGPIYFVSYTFVAAVVMANVVIAILLDNYLLAIDRQNDERDELRALQLERAEQAALDARRALLREQARCAAALLRRVRRVRRVRGAQRLSLIHI